MSLKKLYFPLSIPLFLVEFYLVITGVIGTNVINITIISLLLLILLTSYSGNEKPKVSEFFRQIVNTFLVRLGSRLSISSLVLTDRELVSMFEKTNFSLKTILIFIFTVLGYEFFSYVMHYMAHIPNNRFTYIFYVNHATHHAAFSEKYENLYNRSSIINQFILYSIPFGILVLSLKFFNAPPELFVSLMFIYYARGFIAPFVHESYSEGKLDKFYEKLFIVTGSFHSVHHNDGVDGANHNFSSNITIFDHIFGTYKPFNKDDPQKFGLAGAIYNQEKNIFLREFKDNIIPLKLILRRYSYFWKKENKEDL